MSGLATEGRSHQLSQRSSPLQTDAPGPALPEALSVYSPSAAPAHLRSMDFLGNPARATQVFQDASAGPEQNDDVPENAATLHGTTDSESGLACWQHLTAPSHKTSKALLPRTPSSSGKFSSTELSGAPDSHLSRLRWCPTSQLSADSVTVPALAGPVLHSALPTGKRTL